jgi:RNA polymerase sigma-70 factor (ECF subfamily)
MGLLDEGFTAWLDGFDAQDILAACRPLEAFDDRLLVDLWFEAGIGDAWTTLCARHDPFLKRVIARIVPPEAVEDVLQEAHISFLKCLPQFDWHARFQSWAHTVVTNHALIALRRDKTVRTRHTDVPDMDRMPALEGHLEDPAVGIALRAAVAALQPSLREVVCLFDLHERSVAEVAQVLGVREGLVRQRLHRARKVLAGRLEGVGRSA